MCEYLITYTYRQWTRDPRSPFSVGKICYRDPSAAHEMAMRLRAQGHANVLVTPRDTSECPLCSKRAST